MTTWTRTVVWLAACLALPASGACASGSEAIDEPAVGAAGSAGSGGGLAGAAGAAKAGSGGGAGQPGGSAGAAAKSGASGASGTSGASGASGAAGGCGAEICDNGADDDCDGLVDEDCSCVPGAVAACFASTADHRGKGVCKDGVMHCTSTGEFGTWLACEGDVLPGVEVCDPQGLDEDCDGTANEGCECKAGSPPAPCGSSVGECKEGTQACVGGMLAPCVGSVEPSPEVCDGKDNDCDGKIDEDLSRPCGDSKGVCTLGLQHCKAGTWGACEGATLPSEELCNGLDDDCDGMVDEDVVAACGTATGACKIGLQVCKDGVLGPCVGAIGPQPETCNGLDDDCDGKVDQGLDLPCGSAEGTCKLGVSRCVGGAYTACEGGVAPAPETCDGLDNDCNGTVDQGCGCVVGSAPVACGSDVGACKKGLQACVAGTLGPCVGGVVPTLETCNGVDDDCNGQVDDGVIEACGSSLGACKPGVRVCAAGAFGACVGDVGPVAETCNGIDDDCDGMVDEGLVAACGSDVGRCAAGVQTCVAGAWSACVGAVGPIAEVCDGAIDEDCDGVVDNGCGCTAGAKLACGSKVGACKQGEQTCDAAGAWGPCVGGVAPASESCNGVDDDCDGAVDEGCECVTGDVLICGTNVGQCSFGLKTCSASGAWGPCLGGAGPQAELCNGLDDDCDGMLDEGCQCVFGQTRPCGSTVGQCKAGVETCSLAGVYGACAGAIGPATEACNGLDDDCDGMTDEGGVCPSAPPVVACPASATTTVGLGVPLVAQASDPGGGALTSSWSVTAKPGGSTAQPAPATSPSTQLVPDLPGVYELTYCATNASSTSSCCKTTVTAAAACSPPPTAPVVSTCGTSWDRRPIVTFAPLPAGIFYEVWVVGASSPTATLTLQGQNYFRPAAALGAGGPPPGVDLSLQVKACKSDNPTCCSTSNVATAKLVEACSTVVPATAANVVISEYVVNGSGSTAQGPTFQAGEAIEITNLSHCPVSLDGDHFGYQNYGGGAFRWMNFAAADVIPPRGVYVAIRAQAATQCALPFLGADDPSLFGLKVSKLDMQGDDLGNGWFNNNGGGTSTLRVATGPWVSITAGTTISQIKPYAASNPRCDGVGFDAIDSCGDVVAGGQPSDPLHPNQLGRLWHPCDRVVNPVPSNCHLVSKKDHTTMRRTSLTALLAVGLGIWSTPSWAVSTTVVISEFRPRGSSGGNDEFIELYNLTNAPINIGGYKVSGSNSSGSTSVRATIPANTIIPAKGFYLIANLGTNGYSGAVTQNQGYDVGAVGITDDGGVALLTGANVVVDAVGMSAGSAYKEGTALASFGATNGDRSYRRKSANCTPDVDTDNNANDFTMVTPSTPQNSSSCCLDSQCSSPPAGQCYGDPGTCNATAGTCSYSIQPGKACDDADACTETDVCLAGGACQGTNKSCNSPPPPVCATPTTQRTFASNGTCSAGNCSYASTDTPCVTTCNPGTGLCADPCLGVTCNTPPNLQCYASSGTCSTVTGSCVYPPKGVGTACDDADGCTESDVCDAAGQCAGTPKVCTPPPAACIGQASRTYSGGTCDSGTSSCTFTQTELSCQFGCDPATGLCKANPCAGVTCVTPPGACHVSSGLCDQATGQCAYAEKPSGSPCDDGVACTDSDVCDGAGTCGGSAKVCTPPAPTCASASVSRSFSSGTCTPGTGACTFQQTDTNCTSGCNSGTGLCNNDPCAGVVCDKPTSSCQLSTGVCSGGTCTYPLKPENAQCDDGDACTSLDRCNAVGVCQGTTLVCNTPPATSCDTPTSSLAYAPVGTCQAGTCTYASASTPCANGCDAGTGLCAGDPCTDVQCTAPPSACHVAVGTCAGGTCSYALKQAGSACNDADACTTNDACSALGTCKGTVKSCTTPPAATCVDSKTSRTYSATGTCQASDGSCTYQQLDTACATTCDTSTGLCSGDPCATVKCDKPPSACHAPTGTCSGGTCTYTPLQVGAACNDGNVCTVNDSCNAAGACVGVAKVCNTPPSPECNSGKSSQTYAALGTCSPVDGVCGYDVTTVTCATSCDLASGLCVNDPCNGITCNKPTSTCQVATGSCAAGKCSYPNKPSGAACDDGDACTDQDTCDAAGTCAGKKVASCGGGGAGGAAGAAGSGGKAGTGGAAAGASGSTAGGAGGSTAAGAGGAAAGAGGKAGGGSPATAGKSGGTAAGAAGSIGVQEDEVEADSPGCGCETPGHASPRGWAFGLGALFAAWSASRRKKSA